MMTSHPRQTKMRCPWSRLPWRPASQPTRTRSGPSGCPLGQWVGASSVHRSTAGRLAAGSDTVPPVPHWSRTSCRSRANSEETARHANTATSGKVQVRRRTGLGRTSRPVSRILCPPRAAGDGHPSGHTVTGCLERSTRGLGRAALPVRHRTSIRAVAPRAVRPSTLLRAGFTEPPRSPGVLVRSYHTVSPLPRRRGRGGLFSVALSRGSPRVAVSNRPALWSPDFPRAGAWPPVGAGSPVRGRPADSFAAPV